MTDTAGQLAHEIRSSPPGEARDRARAQWRRATKLRRAADATPALERQQREDRAERALEHLVLAALLEEAARNHDRVTARYLGDAYLRLKRQAIADPPDFAIMLARRLGIAERR